MSDLKLWVLATAAFAAQAGEQADARERRGAAPITMAGRPPPRAEAIARATGGSRRPAETARTEEISLGAHAPLGTQGEAASGGQASVWAPDAGQSADGRRYTYRYPDEIQTPDGGLAPAPIEGAERAVIGDAFDPRAQFGPATGPATGPGTETAGAPFVDERDVAPLAAAQSPASGDRRLDPAASYEVAALAPLEPFAAPSTTAAPDQTEAVAIEPLARAPRPRPAVSGGRYYIQVGAFANYANVERARVALQSAGEVTIESRAHGVASIHRVRLGGWATRAEAEAVRDLIAGMGYPDGIIGETRP